MIAVRLVPDFHRQVLAVNRVERLLNKLTGALDGAEVAYAIVGGNAVAAWVATVDDGAVRATKDVDLLLRREDLQAAQQAAASVSLDPHEVHGVPMLLTRRNPNPKTGVHIIFAEVRVRESDLLPAPDVTRAERTSAGFLVLDLPSLVQMKLVANRRRDQVHIEDMLSVGLISESIIQGLPEELRRRLEFIRTTE